MPDDDRYFVVDGRRWRKTDPDIPDKLEKELVSELMSARRAVKSAKSDGDDDALSKARERVHAAKLALGERGYAWWEPREPDKLEARIVAAIQALLRSREPGKTICPSDAARIAGGEHWRDLMPKTRKLAVELQQDGWLDILQRGEPVTPPFKGPIRLRRRD